MCVCMVRSAMRVHKSISLTVPAAERAEAMDNFSAYICECLEGDMHLRHEAIKRWRKSAIDLFELLLANAMMHENLRKRIVELI